MSDPEADEALTRARTTGSARADDDERAASPFDHPAFLPVLVWAMALWFGYDGWFNERSSRCASTGTASASWSAPASTSPWSS